MKFETSIEIEAPREIVCAYFSNPKYLGEYQDGFVSKTLLEGAEGEKDAKSLMHYKQGKRSLELTETILENQLPDLFSGFYHHVHMDNTMTCRFSEISENRTLYRSEFEYVRISWVMPKLMFMLFPKMFKKQGEKWMIQFKEFVEKEYQRNA